MNERAKMIADLANILAACHPSCDMPCVLPRCWCMADAERIVETLDDAGYEIVRKTRPSDEPERDAR